MGKSFTPPMPEGTVAVPLATVARIVQALDTIAGAACKASLSVHEIVDLTRGGAPIDDEVACPANDEVAPVVDLARYRNAKIGGAA